MGNVSSIQSTRHRHIACLLQNVAFTTFILKTPSIANASASPYYFFFFYILGFFHSSSSSLSALTSLLWSFPSINALSFPLCRFNVVYVFSFPNIKLLMTHLSYMLGVWRMHMFIAQSVQISTSNILPRTFRFSSSNIVKSSKLRVYMLPQQKWMSPNRKYNRHVIDLVK